MKLLTDKSIEEYKRSLFGGDNIDCGLIDDIDRCGSIIVGQQYEDGEIVGIFAHSESDCAWMVFQNPAGQLIEVDIPYSDDWDIFGGRMGIKELQSLELNKEYYTVCMRDCCNNFHDGCYYKLKRIYDNGILVDNVAVIDVNALAGKFMLVDEDDLPF